MGSKLKRKQLFFLLKLDHVIVKNIQGISDFYRLNCGFCSKSVFLLMSKVKF